MATGIPTPLITNVSTASARQLDRAGVVRDDSRREGEHNRLDAVVRDVAVEQLRSQARERAQEHHDGAQIEQDAAGGCGGEALHHLPIT